MANVKIEKLPGCEDIRASVKRLGIESVDTPHGRIPIAEVPGLMLIEIGQDDGAMISIGALLYNPDPEN